MSDLSICFLSQSSVVHCRRWVNALSERGHQIHLLSPDEQTPSEGHFIHQSFYPKGKTGIQRLQEGIQNTFSIRAMIRKLDPDLIHLMGLFPVFAPDLMWTVFQTPSPLVVSTWGSDIIHYSDRTESLRSRWIKYFLMAQGDQLTATSSFQVRHMKQYMIKQRPVHKVPFGVNLDLFRPKIRKDVQGDKRFTLIYTKSLEERYGPFILLKAIAELSDLRGTIRLKLAGRGPARQRLKKCTNELDLNSCVEFLGHVPHDQVPEMYADVDIAVMPSLQESFGVAAAEALAMEVPVIASDVGGVDEIVKHNRTGLLVPPGKKEALSRAIRTLLQNEKKRTRLGRRGRKHVQTSFDWNENVSRMEEIYHQTRSG